MSIRLLQSTIPQEYIQTIRVNDATIRGNLVANNSVTIVGGLTTNSNVSIGTSLTHKNIVGIITQSTSISTAIDASAVANPYNFNVETFTATTASGLTDRFFINMPTGILQDNGFTSISTYYYSGVIGTAGIPQLSILTQEANRLTILLKNEDTSNALNGYLRFRIKHELGSSSS